MTPNHGPKRNYVVRVQTVPRRVKGRKEKPETSPQKGKDVRGLTDVLSFKLLMLYAHGATTAVSTGSTLMWDMVDCNR